MMKSKTASAYKLIEPHLGVPPVVDLEACVEIPIFVDGKKFTGDPGIHCCDNPSLQMGDCMSGSVVQRYEGKTADGTPLPHVVWISFGRHDGRGSLYNVEVGNSVQMIGYNRKTGATAFFESGDNRKWVRVDPKTNRLIGKLAGVDEPAAFNRAYATPGQTQSCRWSDRLTLMPRSKRQSVSAACFDRIDELLSSSGVRSVRPAPVPKQFVRYLLRGNPVFDHFLASGDLAGLNLDRESSPICPRTHGFHSPKCSFEFFDHTGF